MNQTADTRDSDVANKPTTNLTTVRPRSSLANGIVSGLISGAMNIPCCIALASIIFLGDLRPYFPLGIGLCLVGNAMVSAVASLRSGCRYGIATIQDSTPAIVSLMALSIASKTHATASMFPTVVAAIALSTLTMGLMLYGLGRFRLGIGARFVPPSVVSGFLAGTGVILILGGLGFLMNTNLSINNLDQLWSAGAPERWLPGLLFGVALLAINLRYQQSWVLPTILFGSALIFSLSLPIFHISTQEAIARGWIEGGFQGGRLWPPFGTEELSQIDWRILNEHWIHYLVIAFVGSLALLMNLSGLEQATGEAIDIDQELKGNGVANLAGGDSGWRQWLSHRERFRPFLSDEGSGSLAKSDQRGDVSRGAGNWHRDFPNIPHFFNGGINDIPWAFHPQRAADRQPATHFETGVHHDCRDYHRNHFLRLYLWCSYWPSGLLSLFRNQLLKN